jgi:hypothetical protein
MEKMKSKRALIFRRNVELLEKGKRQPSPDPHNFSSQEGNFALFKVPADGKL